MGWRLERGRIRAISKLQSGGAGGAIVSPVILRISSSSTFAEGRRFLFARLQCAVKAMALTGINWHAIRGA
jgi:hypothetical protein